MWERLDAQLCFIICLIQYFICVCIYIRVMTGQFSVCVVPGSSMGVSLATYRARIGLFHPSASSSSEFKPNVFISKSSACALQITVNDIIALCYMLTLVNTLLVICGDIELNPGPGDIPNSDHTRYFSFCHENMRSIKRCPEKLDHIKAELSGTYDVITISETWLSPEDNLDPTW